MLIYSLLTVSIFLLLVTLLPFFPISHGLVRIFDFPRIQITATAALVLLFSAVVFDLNLQALAYIFSMTVLTISIQFCHIARFSPLWPKRSKTYLGNINDVSSTRLLISNVKQSNQEFDRLINLIKDTQPDVIVLMEVDANWDQALIKVSDQYPYQIKHVLNNTYGIMLLSRFKLNEEKIRFLLNPEVPSIDAVVEHPKGDRFRIFALHPEPPLPHRDTIGRDAEIAFAGKVMRTDDTPAIVCGDLNDVAWSRTTRRFLRISRLLDPREGRGMFNTFDARYFLIRWPLDHIFHTPHFQLINMKRMENIGSDHFPMLYDLALTNSKSGHRELDQTTPAELKDVQGLIDIEKDRERKPAGHNWENLP